jgi:hypothetical protein
MNKKKILILFVTAGLLLLPISAAAQTNDVVIPYSDGWKIDGEVDESERGTAAEMPTEGLPFTAIAMSNTEELYLSIELTDPNGEWEIFLVSDNGDGDFYNTGDTMILCTSDGCQLCTYEEQYQYDCTEDVTSAVTGAVIELEVAISALGAGKFVIGGVFDGIELVSDPFEAEFEKEPQAVLPEASEEAPPAQPTEIVAQQPSEISPASPLSITTIAIIAAVVVVCILAFWKSIWEFIKKLIKKILDALRRFWAAFWAAVRRAAAEARRREAQERRDAARRRREQERQRKRNEKAREAARRAREAMERANRAAENARAAARDQKNVSRRIREAEAAAKQCWAAADAADAAANQADAATAQAARGDANNARLAGNDAWAAAQEAAPVIGRKPKQRPR